VLQQQLAAGAETPQTQQLLDDAMRARVSVSVSEAKPGALAKAQPLALPVKRDSEALPVKRDSEALPVKRDRILAELKLGKQAPGYKVALKVLNRFIDELSLQQ